MLMISNISIALCDYGKIGLDGATSLEDAWQSYS